MHFPFAYTGELVFYKTDEFNVDEFIKLIELQLIASEKVKQQLIFSAPFSYSKLPINITLSVVDDNTSIHCKYTISLFENNMVLLLALTFSIFFFHFNNVIFAITSLVFGVLFYFFNTLKISNSIKELIYNQIGGNADIGTPELWNQQQKWMKDANLCPACGEPKNTYSNKCINCGLYFSKKNMKITNVNSSLPVGSEIIYEVTKKNK
jgi:hypothetical protein